MQNKAFVLINQLEESRIVYIQIVFILYDRMFAKLTYVTIRNK